MAEELKLDVKDFNPLSEIHDDDRFMMTQAANAHFAASMPFKTFKEKVLQPIIENSRPGGMGCEIFTSVDEYKALTEYDPKTMYVIIENSQITQAFLGEYPFNVGGGGESGIPIEHVFVDLETLVLELGENKQLTATYDPSDATNTTLSWTTSNRLVGTVSNGLVTSVGKGECIIKVKARSGAFAECVVTVEITLIGLSFSSANNKLVSGYTTQLEPIPVPENASLYLTYSSSDTSIATVDQTGLVTPVASTGEVTIAAVNKNGVRSSITMTIAPFAVSVSCQGMDKADNSVSNIFSKWHLIKKGVPTHYKYTETINENGTESTLQSVDWTPIPDDGIVDIELYAEFGYKYINWSFKNADDSYEEVIVTPVLYKEPDLVTYNFDVDVQCTPEQAQAMSMEIPYYKYDKKFVYNLRNDDNGTALWRTAFRYVNREWQPRQIKVFERPDADQDALLPADRWKSPRRLGYTNGCGVLIPFEFDTAGQVLWADGTKSFEDGDSRYVQRSDILRHKDYGGHFLIHNMAIFASDPVQPKYENDYSYPLQRDRQILFDAFNYNSTTYCNPDGDPYYTQPCIKDPRTLLLSGGGFAFDTPESLASGGNGSNYGTRFPDAVSHYGLPSHRKVYGWGSDLSAVPLSEIRNTLMVMYVYSNNHPYLNPLWKTQLQTALSGKPSLATELTHQLGFNINSGGQYDAVNSETLKNDLKFFEEIFDTVGANGNDMIWLCPADESIEYMYYQRVAKITKTLTQTGCHFTINIQIPDYLSYKTYSAIIRHLPETAILTRGQGVTMFHKNMKTGLINFGYSLDIPERAARYVQQYLNDPTNDNLDRAWYFVKQLGELRDSYASKLPSLNECPMLSSASCPDTTTETKINVTTVNSNKEFGEANFLDVSYTSDFADYKSYAIPSGAHKYYDQIDAECMYNEFEIDIKPQFGTAQNIYVRLRNVYGDSESKSIVTTLTREQGVNDPLLLVTAESTYFNSDIELSLVYENVTDIRYKLNSNQYTDWLSIRSKVSLSLTEGDNTIVVEARNNLNEIVTQTITTRLVSAEWESKLTATYMDTYNYGNNVASAYVNGFCKLPRAKQETYKNPLVDTNGVQRGVINNLWFTDNTYGFMDGKFENVNWYIAVGTFGDSSALYPDAMIAKKTTVGHVQTGYKLKDGYSGRSAFIFKELPVGKYIVNLFGRHQSQDQTGTGVAFVRNHKDEVLTNYITHKEFNGQFFYENKSNILSLEFEVTSVDQEFQIGMDARYDLYGNDATDRQYGFNVIHLIKIQE